MDAIRFSRSGPLNMTPYVDYMFRGMHNIVTNFPNEHKPGGTSKVHLPRKSPPSPQDTFHRALSKCFGMSFPWQTLQYRTSSSNLGEPWNLENKFNLKYDWSLDLFPSSNFRGMPHSGGATSQPGRTLSGSPPKRTTALVIHAWIAKRGSKTVRNLGL